MKYHNHQLQTIRFPLGGIGTGSVSLAGNGALVDWEIFNRPNKGSLNGYSHFAVRAQFPDGSVVIKALLGDHTGSFMGEYEHATGFHGFGFGPASQTMSGFPHFRHVVFDGTFPIANITFTDPDFPAKVTLTGWNPLIPLAADDSGIPAAFFRIRIKSLAENVKYTVVLSVGNPFDKGRNIPLPHSHYQAVQLCCEGVDANHRDYGDLTVATDGPNGFSQTYWYRGDWQDGVTTFWQELQSGTLRQRHYETAGAKDMCSVGCEWVLGRAESRDFRFVLAWNIPNYFKYWKPSQDEVGNDILWKNYYATLFADSGVSCFYGLDNYQRLLRQTSRFCRSLHTATLDKAVIDAVSSALSVLKSPTVLRLENGSFYGWEGVTQLAGSCQGSCTHVWSYAYALCFLFPELERSLRDTEFTYSTDAHGRMYFRTALPLGRHYIQLPPCVDGQMATVIKIYRDWKITGDSCWLQAHWQDIQKILSYAWSEHNPFEWDKNKDGVLEGCQHHTLDMELFGPSAWLQGLYLGALKAASEMAAFLGHQERQAEYSQLFQKGYQWTKENLFNGRYFYHQVDLQDQTYTTHFQRPDYWNNETGQLKYQIGEGCEIDQLLGQWHANLCGLGDLFDKQQRQIALRSMFQYNFKASLRKFANMWRVFALNDESGAVICDYPAGSQKPAIPIPYCEECMTGFEYAFAGLLVSEGFLQEGIMLVRAIRNRYDGKKRNPWNEIECGSHYARSLASFALLPIFSGLPFDMPRQHIGFAPVIAGDFQCPWYLGSGWGDFIRTGKYDRIQVAGGSLTIKSIALDRAAVIAVYADGKPIPFVTDEGCITFDTITINKELKVEVST